LTPTQIRVLTLLSGDADSGMSVGAIAECLNLSAPSASRLCQRLVRDGLVARAAGPGHHILISLSDAGAATLTEVNQQRVGPLRDLIDNLPPRTRSTVSRALVELNRHAVDDLDLW
jgi:DNA-binding MarR family transcriptional regulator